MIGADAAKDIFFFQSKENQYDYWRAVWALDTVIENGHGWNISVRFLYENLAQTIIYWIVKYCCSVSDLWPFPLLSLNSCSCSSSRFSKRDQCVHFASKWKASCISKNLSFICNHSLSLVYFSLHHLPSPSLFARTIHLIVFGVWILPFLFLSSCCSMNWSTLDEYRNKAKTIFEKTRFSFRQKKKRLRSAQWLRR